MNKKRDRKNLVGKKFCEFMQTDRLGNQTSGIIFVDDLGVIYQIK